MPLSKEEKQKMLEERRKAYYSTSHIIADIVWRLKTIDKNRGHTIAFKQLMLALDGYEQQIRNDFSRYEKQIRRSDHRDEAKELQKALNRERTLREQLENKVREASESSGLFISYVRKKLNF